MHTTIQAITLPDTTTVATRSQAMIQEAERIQVSTPVEYEGASGFLKTVRGLIKEVKSTFTEPKRAADAAHDAICAAEKKHLTPLQTVDFLIENKMKCYLRIEDQRQREAQLAKQAELRKIEEDRRLREAEALEKAGKAKQAEALLAKPVVAPAVIVQSEVPKIAGQAARTTWHAEVTDLMALIKHVAEHPEHIHLIEANMTALNGMARSLKGAMSIPGVQAVSDLSLSVRS